MILPPHHRPFGSSALLVELDDLAQVLALDRALRRNRPGWASDIIPAARTLLVRFDAADATLHQVSSWIDTAPIDTAPIDTSPIDTSPITTADASRDRSDAAGASDITHDGAPPAPHTVEIPVRYDGADLARVAELTGLTVDEVITRHCAGRYTVAFCGFAPGFGYLTGVPAALRVPRRTSPRTTVPAGAVALADEFTAVYPRASPGGWQLIGSTTLSVFDADRDPPALLAPGDQVRFVRAAG